MERRDGRTTCAACHTAQLNYKGKQIRIDGGIANRFDFMAYMPPLTSDASDLDRRGKVRSPGGANRCVEFRRQERIAQALCERRRAGALLSHHAAATPTAWGPGRMMPHFDLNRLTTTNPRFRRTCPPPGASQNPLPLEFPAGDVDAMERVTQDPILRNYGETMGVYLSIDLRSKTPEEGLFDSAAASSISRRSRMRCGAWRRPNGRKMCWARSTARRPPGKALFVTNCAGCHNSYPYTWTEPNKYGKRFIQVGLVPEIRGYRHAADVRPEAVHDHRSVERPIAAAVQGQGSYRRLFSREPSLGKSRKGTGATQTERSADPICMAFANSRCHLHHRTTTRRRRATGCGPRRHSCITVRYPIFTRC